MARLSNPFLVFGFIYAIPFLIGVIFAEWTDREFHIHLGWAAISIAYCYIFRFKPLIVLISLFFVLAACIDIQYAMIFKGVFTSSSVEAMEQTNKQEAVEFMASYFDPWAIVTTLIYLVVSLWLLYRLKCPGLPEKRAYQALSLFFFIVLCGFIVQGLIIKKRYTKLLPGIVGAYPAYFKGNIYLADEINERAELVSVYEDFFSNAVSSDQTYVIVIGEATSRHHMSLYGYPRNTSPKLSQQKDLIIFDNVISNFVQTLPSLRYTLTLAEPNEVPAFNKALSIVDAANISGFKTFWISNQQPLRGTYSAIGEQADVTTFISNIYHGREVGRYDGLILPEYEKALNDKAPKKAIFIHLMGSHLKYTKRYPKAFDQFSGPPYYAYRESPSAKERFYIDSYDNSILYNDAVVSELLVKLEQASNDIIAGFNYMADHGEEVFDTMPFKGHGPDTLTPSSFDIPFLVWVSEAYRQAFPSKIKQLKENVHKPYMMNDYFFFATDLMNVSTTVLSPEYRMKSLFSSDVNVGDREIYGNNYDELFNRKRQAPQTQAVITAQ
ncbi:MAG: phosphoethanolamine transferase [Cellvibrionales bacterium]|nr:phosphoethanolamine transferase [Cellvibrionales bacterium]